MPTMLSGAMNFLFRPGSGSKAVAIAAAAATVGATVAVIRLYKRHKDHQARLEQIKQAEQKKWDAFENRFLREYDALAEDPDAPVPAAHAHVRETTPQGDVIMTYDADRCAFCYYSDTRSVQFKYLEPVARKYVLEHGCKRLYIDMRKELAKTTNAATTNAATTSAATTSAATTSTTKSVFAQLKKYGIKPSSSLSALSSSLPSSSSSPSSSLKEQVTRYWYCGKLDEFNTAAHDSVAQEHDFSVIKPIDYASYKKLSTA
jgi:hypothetical protein